jgi:hypothetical protein
MAGQGCQNRNLDFICVLLLPRDRVINKVLLGPVSSCAIITVTLSCNAGEEAAGERWEATACECWSFLMYFA